jgi:C4-dicarboxylate-specific signal transduction histidine kinase
MNNPLGAIRLHLQLVESMIADDAPEAAEIRESLALMDGCVTQIQEIMGTIRRVARGAELSLSEVSLNDVIRAAVVPLEKKLRESGIRLEIEGTEELPRIQADARQLQEAIESLVVNSIDAVSRSSSPRLIRILAAAERELVSCTVRDSGGGPIAGGEELFDPFYTTRERQRGLALGLGLPIARAICRAHGGDLRLTSAPGEGAAFTFWIPRA